MDAGGDAYCGVLGVDSRCWTTMKVCIQVHGTVVARNIHRTVETQLSAGKVMVLLELDLSSGRV